MIRQPIVNIPAAGSQILQSRVSLQRLSKFLNSEENAPPFPVDETLPAAVTLDADFTWEEQIDEQSKRDAAAPPPETARAAEDSKTTEQAVVDVATPSGTSTPTVKRQPFTLSNLNITVPKGSFVAFVGRVGCGKSSLMEALAGGTLISNFSLKEQFIHGASEMRKTRGQVVLGGTIAYAPATPWMVNATLKDNIVTFGTGDIDEERYVQYFAVSTVGVTRFNRYARCVQACALDHDIDTLSHQDSTEIGERGINLSGGQKVRPLSYSKWVERFD